MGGNAIADTDGDIRCWTTNEDVYYHMKQDCRDEKMFPISESSALAFGKTACGNCVEVQAVQIVHEPSDISLSVRNGTYVMCIPCESLEDVSSLNPYDSPESAAYVKDEAWQQLACMMPAGNCADIRRRLEADGWASDICSIPILETGEDTLLMSKRLIGDEWYFVFRPDKPYEDGTELKWRTEEWNVHMEGYGNLTVTNTGYANFVSKVEAENHSDALTVFQRDYESVRITVYRKQGMNTAVLQEKQSSKALSGRVFLEGKDIGAAVNGYINGQKQGTYCCVISDAELAGIVAGDMVEIRH